MGFIADPGCRRDSVTRLKSLYDAERSCVELTAARLGEDPRIAVPQHDDRTLNQSLGTRVPLLIKFEAVLQCLVDNVLHPGVYRRVNLDPSLQKVFNAEVSAEVFELLKNIVKDRGRLDTLILVVARPLEWGTAAARFALSREIKPFATISARV